MSGNDQKAKLCYVMLYYVVMLCYVCRKGKERKGKERKERVGRRNLSNVYYYSVNNNYFQD